VNTCFAPHRLSSLVAVVLEVVLACTLGACGSSKTGGPPPAAPQTYVGTIDKTDAVAGAVAANGSALLFFCGGAQSYATLTHWMRGSVSLDGPFTLTDGTWTAKGQPGSAGISGTIDPGGGQALLTWSVRPVVSGTLEGLYDAQVDGGLPTLIVTQPTPSATPTGQGAFKLASTVEQVVPLMPIQWVADEGIAVDVTVSGAAQQVFVTRAQP
jgi:hypothetical protein